MSGNLISIIFLNESMLSIPIDSMLSTFRCQCFGIEDTREAGELLSNNKNILYS